LVKSVTTQNGQTVKEVMQSTEEFLLCYYPMLMGDQEFHDCIVC